MAQMKIVFFTTLDPELRQVVVDKARPGMNVIAAPTAMPDEEKIKLIKDADFIMFPGRLSDRVLQAAKKCKLVQLLSAGYDQMHLPLAADLGIPVANNGGANRVAVSEHTRTSSGYGTVSLRCGWPNTRTRTEGYPMVCRGGLQTRPDSRTQDLRALGTPVVQEGFRISSRQRCPSPH